MLKVSIILYRASESTIFWLNKLSTHRHSKLVCSLLSPSTRPLPGKWPQLNAARSQALGGCKSEKGDVKTIASAHWSPQCQGH
jgi:hypothetical protein